ncbi:MAG: hypothetical protein HOW73_18480 [Polyangiaceae bacterium]|nr:hypothetical protein [Polyangiaceae bacterium]
MKLFAPLTILGLLCSCAALDEPMSQEPRSPADVQAATSIEESADRLAEAYCDHAQECHAVGKGARFSSPEQCRESMRTEIEAELATEARCDTGIGVDDLKECEQAIESDTCRELPASYAQMRRPGACDTRNICLQ